MSYSTMIPFTEAGHGEYVEFRNAWGMAAFVWTAIQHRLGWTDDWYLDSRPGARERRGWGSRMEAGEDRPLWDLHKNTALPDYERIVHVSTFVSSDNTCRSCYGGGVVWELIRIVGPIHVESTDDPPEVEITYTPRGTE